MEKRNKHTVSLMLQVHELAQPLTVDGRKTVIIDGGGVMIKLGAQTGIHVSGGATLCVVNAVLDGQQKSRALFGTDSGTSIGLIDVIFQNCKTRLVRPLFRTCCLADAILLHCICAHCPKRLIDCLVHRMGQQLFCKKGQS